MIGMTAFTDVIKELFHHYSSIARFPYEDDHRSHLVAPPVFANSIAKVSSRASACRVNRAGI